MIFFRKKKPAAPPPKPAKPAPVKPAKKPEPPAAPETKILRSLQEIAHTRVLTAEGWRRSMEKKLQKKSK